MRGGRTGLFPGMNLKKEGLLTNESAPMPIRHYLTPNGWEGIKLDVRYFIYRPGVRKS